MRFCLNTDCLGYMPFEEMLDTVAELGYESIEIACGNWSKAPHIDLDAMLESEQTRKSFMDAIAKRGLVLEVLGLTIQYPFVDGMTGMGLVKWGLTFSMLRKGIFLISVFVLPPIFGATAVMFSEPLSDVVSAVFSGCAAMFLLPKLVAKQCCK